MSAIERYASWPSVRMRDLLIHGMRREQRRALLLAEQVSFLPMEAIGEQGELDLSIVRDKEDVNEGYTQFFDGDVLVAKITPCFENGKGAVVGGLLNGIGFGTTELYVLRPGPDVDARFLYYVTASPVFRRHGEASMIGAAGQKRVPTEFILNYSVDLPTLIEQRAIADYLDRETAEIDEMVAAKERLLALLAEKRRALITEAVTRGLDAGVALRDSGVEWLGEIPLHWDVIRLKLLGDVRSGVAKGRQFGNRETVMVPYLRVANVQDGYLDLADVAEIEVLPHEVATFALRQGDVLMNEGGDADKLGRGTVWDGSVEPCLHQNHVFAVRCFDVNPAWLTIVTGSDYAKAYFESRAKQSTNLASISATNLQELPVIIPPRDEQHAIMSYLDSALMKLDMLWTTTERTISLLSERRAALIAAAVTSQISMVG